MNKKGIEETLNLMKEKNHRVIPESYSKQIFEYMGMNIPKQGIATNVEEAVTLAKTIGFPIVLKVHSFKITHKSEAKGVLVGLQSLDEVRDGFNATVKNAQEYLKSDEEIHVSVQQMLEPEIEVIVGMKRDPIFGPTLLFGLGGVWVEIMKDVSLRVSPLREKDVDEMIAEIKGKKLLGDFRGKKARDLESLKRLILQVERLAVEFPEIAEIDLNPIFLYEKGKDAVAVDARIILSSGA